MTSSLEKIVATVGSASNRQSHHYQRTVVHHRNKDQNIIHHHHRLRSGRHALPLLGLVFLTIQTGLLFCGYQVSQIPVRELDIRGNVRQQQQQQQPIIDLSHQQQRRRPPPDGILNGNFPVYYHDLTKNTSFHTRPYSQIRCVGENYQRGVDENNIDKVAWMHKSCHFRFVCLNLTSHEFEVYPRPTLEQELKQFSKERPMVDVSASSILLEGRGGLSIGGIGNTPNGVGLLQWFPAIVVDGGSPPERFYALEENVVLAPFHSMRGWDPSSVIWDDFLGIFTLLNMFQFDHSHSSLGNGDGRHTSPYSDEEHRALLMRYVLPEGHALEGSCDANEATYRDCQTTMDKHGPLMMPQSHLRPPQPSEQKGKVDGMGRIPSHLTTQKEAVLKLARNQERQSNLVCAKDAVAGLGQLTDHGTNQLAGVGRRRRRKSHNFGRGGVLWRFRNFCLRNLGLSDYSLEKSRLAGPVVVFSETLGHELAWTQQETLLRQQSESLGLNVEVERHSFADMSLQESVQVVMGTSVLVTDCENRDSVMATFLPRGSSLIVFCDNEDESVNNGHTATRSRVDRDLLNNMSYLFVHWLPKETMDNREDMDAFVGLIQHKLQAHKSVLHQDKKTTQNLR